MESPFTSVLDAFRHQVERDPDARLYAFVSDDGQSQKTLTRGDLLARAETLSGYLSERCGLRHGDRVLLVYPPSIDFVEAFVGCLNAGVIPVPVYPPNPLTLAKDLTGFTHMADNCGARVVLTNRAYALGRKVGSVRSFIKGARARWPRSLIWHTTDTIETGAFAGAAGPAPSPDEVALLQYTSGSTSAPRGVMITHGNIAHQLAFNRDALGLGPSARAVVWLPQYHDFGLISSICSALCGNGELTMFSPLAFIKDPALWFDLMSSRQATHTAAPNFAYELAVRKTTPEQRATWDLRSLRVAMSAAEPVRPRTVARFLEAFTSPGTPSSPATMECSSTAGTARCTRCATASSMTTAGCGCPSACWEAGPPTCCGCSTARAPWKRPWRPSPPAKSAASMWRR